MRWTTLILAFSLIAAPVRAEEEPSASTAEVPLPTLPAQETPPPQEQQDRKDGAGAAAAMAAVGAAMAGLSCAMLLKQAAAEMDPAKKAQLRAQAMQQCAQAAQNAANAAQNNDSKEKLAATDGSPKGVNLSYVPPVTDLRESEQKAATQAAASNSETPSQIAQDTENGPAPEVFDYSIPDDGIDWSGSGFAASESGLQPIQNPKVDFDDNSKGGGTTPGAVVGPSTFSSASTGFGNDALRNLAAQTADAVESLKNGKKRKPKDSQDTVETAANGSDSHSGSSSGAGEESNVSDMLAKIMGKDGGEGAAPALQIADINVAPPTTTDKSLPNIFQYASYRFRKSKRSGEIRPGRISMITRSTHIAAVEP